MELLYFLWQTTNYLPVVILTQPMEIQRVQHKNISKTNGLCILLGFFVQDQHRTEKSENRDTRVGRYGLKALFYFCNNDKSDNKKFLFVFLAQQSYPININTALKSNPICNALHMKKCDFISLNCTHQEHLITLSALFTYLS